MKTKIIYLILFLTAGCASKSPVVEDVSRNHKSNPKVTPVKSAAIDANPSKESSQNSNRLESQNNSDSQMRLSQAIKSQQDEAIFQAASDVLMEDPKNTKAINAMALYNYKKGRFSAAEYLLRRALSLDSRSAEVHSNLGLIHLAQNEKREAISAFRKALEISPEDPVTSANLGSIYVDAKDYNKAIIVLENAVRRGWKDPKILNNYAISLAATGRPEKQKKAEEIYLGLLKDQPNSKEILFNIATLQIDGLKKFNEGRENINRLKFLGVPSGVKKRLATLESLAKAQGR